MKLSKHKKNKIAKLLQKYLPNVSKTFLRKLFYELIAVIEVKKSRSLPALHLYWAWLEFLCPHFPAFRKIRFWSPEIIHELLKKSQDVSSIAFDALGENEFQEYFNNVQEWVSVYVLNCDKDEMIKEFMEGSNG